MNFDKENVFQNLVERYPIITIAELKQLYRNHFPDFSQYAIVKSYLCALKSKGYNLGLITDGFSVTQRNKIKSLGIEELFDLIIISEEFGSEKPNEKNYKIFQFFNKAKAKAIRALEFYEKIPQSQWDVHLGAELYYVLSICYLKNGEEKKALHCFFKQDSMLCNKEDDLSIAMYLQHKADFNLGYSKGDKKISEKLFNQSLPLLKKQKHYVTIARNYMILANMYKTENRIPEYNIMRDSLQKYADISRNPYLKPYNLLEDSYEQIINGNYTRARAEILKVLAEMRKYGLDKTNFYQSAVQDLGEIEWKNKNYD